MNVIVAFRGTVPEYLPNWIVDLEMLSTICVYATRGSSSGGHGSVHCGFLTAYATVKQQLLSALTDIINSTSPSALTLSFTGHSLGGALATVAAADIQTSLGELHPSGAYLPSFVTRVVTFGSPRVGDKAFANYFQNSVQQSWRV